MSSWGDYKDYNKVNLVKNIISYKPRINNKNDEKNMRIYLEKSSKSELVIPRGGINEKYLPMGAPLLDFLTVDTKGPAGGKYPKYRDLNSYQDNIGFTFSVLTKVEVREEICGVSTPEEIEKFHEWITKKHLRNQDDFDSGVLSMDVE